MSMAIFWFSAMVKITFCPWKIVHFFIHGQIIKLADGKIRYCLARQLFLHLQIVQKYSHGKFLFAMGKTNHGQILKLDHGKSVTL